MANKRKACVVRGEVYYAKVIGAPVPTYDKEAKEWTVELLLDKAGEKTFEELGVGDRIKKKKSFLDGKPHFHFKQPELQKSGDRNKPIPVVDVAGNPWPEGVLIGNGSKCDIKFNFVDFGAGKFPGVYIKGIRVLEHVPYEPKPFGDLDEDDEFFAAAQAAEADSNKAIDEGIKGITEDDPEEDDLDDDIPFD